LYLPKIAVKKWRVRGKFDSVANHVILSQLSSMPLLKPMKIFSLRKCTITALTLLTGLGLALSASAKAPAVGDTAPLVSGKDHDGKAWNLADDIGKKVVLLSYSA
jgi:hypothetical protein